MKVIVKQGAEYLYPAPYIDNSVLIVNLARKGLYVDSHYYVSKRQLVIDLVDNKQIHLVVSAPCIITLDQYDNKDQLIFNVEKL
jgi:hypothetical protein